jgi:hypothetical protein
MAYINTIIIITITTRYDSDEKNTWASFLYSGVIIKRANASYHLMHQSF